MIAEVRVRVTSMGPGVLPKIAPDPTGPGRCRAPVAGVRKARAGMITALMTTLLATVCVGDTTEVSLCRDSLGMHSGEIPDSAITASSSYDMGSVGPQNSRIRTEKKGGAWCPKQQINRNVHEYLEIDLGKLKVVTLAETQGRFGNGQGQEFAQYYMLEYQRENRGRWMRFKDRKNKDILNANVNTYIAELRELNPPIIARRVRFVPYSRHPRTVCMRVEVYGCDWKDGLLSYETRQGDKRGTEVNVYDFTYDGQNMNGHLSGGLGQLTDLEEGISNFRLDRQGLGRKAYEWVGWKNDTTVPEMYNQPVEIIFRFDAVRNFSAAYFHSNNLFSKDVRVFRQARLWFSPGGEVYDEEPVVFNYMKDTLIEYARNVVVPIPHRVGRAVKVQLYFEARWIMLSEVHFDSVLALGSYPTEISPTRAGTPIPQGSTTDEVKDGQIEVEVIQPEEKTYMKPVPEDSPTRVTVGAVMHPEPRDRSSLQEEHIGIIIGALAALVLLLVAVGIFVLLRHRNKKQDASAAYGTFEKHQMTAGDVDSYKMSSSSNGVLPGYHMYNVVATSDADFEESTSFKKLKLTDLYREQDATGGQKLGEGSAESELKESTQDLQQSPLYVKLPPEPVFQNLYSRDMTPPPCHPPPLPPMHPSTHPPPPIPPPPLPSALYKVHDIVGPSSADLNGNNFGAGGSGTALPPGAEKHRPMEFPRECLKFIEKLGDGEFGEIHICEIQGENVGKKRKPTLVAVKMLTRDANNIARDQFQREAQILAALKDPNVAQVVGVCTSSEPLCMVLEYTKHGDLNQFLRQHVPEDASNIGDQKLLSYGALVYMASQIASGMKYLESLNMVHRDLATRNCLVGHHYCIRISDLGMGRSLYAGDYFRLEGRTMMPIRWMAWESVMLGKFSGKSDVWAFAVTLWEMMTFCRAPPFADLSDQQVIDNCSHFFKQDSLEAYPAQPTACPREIYDLMCECWNRDESLRPSFREIHMFLQRKNMGYDPKEDSAAMRNTLPETAMV